MATWNNSLLNGDFDEEPQQREKFNQGAEILHLEVMC